MPHSDLNLKKIHYHQCTGGGLRKGEYLQLDHAWLGPTPTVRDFFWQSVLISVVALAHHHSQLRARWDSNHGASPWNPTPHCQLIAVPVCTSVSALPTTLAGLITLTISSVLPVHRPTGCGRVIMTSSCWFGHSILSPNTAQASVSSAASPASPAQPLSMGRHRLPAAVLPR